MPETSSLGLPLLVPEQAQKHVTHNEALTALDAVVQLAVIDRDLTAPPGSPSDGDRYIVAASATGDWAGHDGEIAAWQDGAWAFHVPKIGWRVWVEDEGALLIWTGAAWSDLSALISVLQNLALLGVGTTADATNPFAAKLNKALWTARTAAEGGDGDLRTTMNKETAADVLSLLLQTGFSGRAEIGLVGDDDLLFKVSPDGATWHEALRIDKDDGRITLLDAAKSLADSGPILTHDPSADAHYNGFGFGHYYQSYNFPAGGVGGEDYANAVWGLGVNYGNGSGTQLDNTKPAIGWVFESKYYPGSGSVYQCEAHLQFREASGTSHRVITGAFPHSGSGGQLGFQADIITFLDWSGALKVKWDHTSGAIDFFSTMILRKNVNNVPYLVQLNAAGSAYINLTYIDSQDRARIVAPLYVTGAAPPASSKFVDFQPSSMSTGQVALGLTLPTVTGSGSAISSSGSFSTGVEMLNANSNSTDATAYSRFHARVNGANAGDPIFVANINGVTTACFGIDNSDSDAIVIAASSSPGTNNRIRIDANSVAFGLPAKLPSYTVATVPSASAAGAGASIYVSDETGGAVPAFSDGTNWRRVTDRAVIA
jgi:Protein of unknown function (DUF2793)